VKQVLQDRNGSTVVRDVPRPACPKGGVLVANRCSVISSGTERARVELASKSLIGKARERPDLVREVAQRALKDGIRNTQQTVQRALSQETAVGYSSAGVVIEVGAAVSGIDPGDRVACAGGGHANHAEVVAIPRNLCAPIPGGVSFETASLTTIGAIALHGIRLSEAVLGERVAVIGCGLVGQISVRLLHAAGAEVFAVDLDEARVGAAGRAGADHALLAGNATAEILARTRGIGVDRAIITAAAPSNGPLLQAAEVTRDRGTVIMVGDVRVDAPRAQFYDKELIFRISRSYGPGRYDHEYEERGLDYPIAYVRWTEQRNMECVLDLQARGLLDLSDLVDEVVPVSDAARAYGRLVGAPEDRPMGAIVLSYPDEAAVAEPEPRTAAAPSVSGKHDARGSAPVRVGLIGPGSFAGKVIVPAFTAAGATLELVGGGSGPSAEAATRDLGFSRVAQSEDALIADPNVDAVCIASRHESHARLATAALEAGKHVFCEKPLALNESELDEVLQAAERGPGTVAVGFNRRFSPALVELRKFLGGRSPITANYRVSAGALEPGHWLHDLVEGGGRMVGEGCHFVDCLVYLTGSEVVEVHAAGHGAPDAPLQARDNLLVTLTFADGSIGSIAYVAQGSGRVPKERLEAFAGSRTGVLDDYRVLELFDGNSREKQGGRRQDKGHNAEVAAFVAGVRSGTAPVPIEQIRNVHLAAFAAIESLRTGLPARVPTTQPSVAG
jgi:predicted dehydrogenase/threonine dehydrogenase-like Zn-dependent dehydrogenase